MKNFLSNAYRGPAPARFIVLPLLIATLMPAIAHAAVDYSKELLPAPAKIEVSGPEHILPANLILWSTAQPKNGFDPASPLAKGYPKKAWTNAGQILAISLSSGSPPAITPSDAKKAKELGAEEYLLSTTPLPRVLAGGERGLFYGAQTMAQLLRQSNGKLPALNIQDGPAFSHREVHIHGFDKGYGAGDFKSLTAYTQLLPQLWPTIADARYNVFRYSLDAGWILNADQWTGQDVDAAMKRSIAGARANGVKALVEVRWSGIKESEKDFEFYALNPMTDWDLYEKALRRAISWGPDIIDISFNDLSPLNYPDIKQKYGVDGRFSAPLMLEVLEKSRHVIAESKRDIALAHLPRFYADVHWKNHPTALPTMAKAAPAGTLFYVTTPLDNPDVVAARAPGRLRFVQWINFTSNHTKELKVLLDNPTPNRLLETTQLLPPSSRLAVVNLGYPVEPQRSVILATGEMLWNPGAYDDGASQEKAARLVWGPAAQTYLQYARELDFETVMASRGVEAADLLSKPKARATRKAEPPAQTVAKWQSYLQRARRAVALATQLEAVQLPEMEQTAAGQLRWNARRIELDAQIGLAAARWRNGAPLDRQAIMAAVAEGRRILQTAYPVEANDPKSAEVSTRGLRRIEEALSGQDTTGIPLPEAR